MSRKVSRQNWKKITSALARNPVRKNPSPKVFVMTDNDVQGGKRQGAGVILVAYKTRPRRTR